MNNRDRRRRLAMLLAQDALDQARRTQTILERRQDLRGEIRKLMTQSVENRLAQAQALRTGKPTTKQQPFERQNLL